MFGDSFSPHCAHLLRIRLSLLLIAALSSAPAGAAVQNTGRWTPAPGWHWAKAAIHLSLLPGVTNGTQGAHSRVLWWNGWGEQVGFVGGLYGWSPGSNAACTDTAGLGFTPVSLGGSPGYNVFCAGHTLMSGSNGKKLLVSGGTEHGEIGAKQSVIFDPDNPSNPWTPTDDLETARWYPSVSRLASGEHGA